MQKWRQQLVNGELEIQNESQKMWTWCSRVLMCVIERVAIMNVVKIKGKEVRQVHDCMQLVHEITAENAVAAV